MRSPEYPDQRADALASRQYGAISTEQALGCGLTRRQVEGRRLSGRYHPSGARGVYLVAGAPPSPHQRAAVAVLSGPEGTLCSHRTAAALHALAPFPTLPIVTVGPRASARVACAHVHRGTVPPVDRDEVDDLPCTGVARTVVDLAAVMGYGALCDVVDDALTRPLTTPDELRAALDRAARRPGRPGRTALLRALEVWTPGPRPGSRPEMQLIRLLTERGLPVPVRQFPVRDASGKEVARVDLAWVEGRLIGEYDGALFHGPRRRSLDAARQRAVEALGWRVERVRKVDLRDPEALCRRFRAALDAPRA